MKNLDQERATHALNKVKELETRSPSLKSKYRAYVERLGPAILINGLGQALASELAAAGHQPHSEEEIAHQLLYAAIQEWICRDPGGVYAGGADLLESIVTQPQERYLKAYTEVIAWLEWHKKFCQAFLQKGRSD